MMIDQATTIDLNQLFKDNSKNIAILPVGCVEQHGPFLPMNADSIIAKGVARYLDEKMGGKCFVYPEISYTNSDSCANFLGTVSVSHECFRNLLREVLSALTRYNFDKIVVVNAHAINEGSINEIVFGMNSTSFRQKKEISPVIAPIHFYRSYRISEANFALPSGKHGDWIENLFVEKFCDSDEMKKKFSVLGNEVRKRENDRLFMEGSHLLGEPIENRSRHGVIGTSYPPKKVSQDELNEVFHAIMRDIVEQFTTVTK